MSIRIDEKTLKNIADELEMGMEVFFHKETGVIETLLDRDQFGWEMKEDELWKPLIDKIESNIDDYIEFRKMRSNESFQIMEDFANAQTDPAFKRDLLDRLRWRKPFRHFKDFVDNSDYRADWFAFKSKAYVHFVKSQLDDAGYDYEPFDGDELEGSDSDPLTSTLQERMNSGGAGGYDPVEDSNEARRDSIPAGDEDLYRKRLITTYQNLLAFKADLFTDALNLAMAGELKPIDTVFEEGDVYTFSIEHLEDAKDVNLQKLVEMIKQLDSLLATLSNLNAIKESELE